MSKSVPGRMTKIVGLAVILLFLVAASCDGTNALLEPDVTVPQPASFTLSSSLGESKRSAFSFKNRGTAPLTFDVASSAAWLTTFPVSGELAPGESQVVELTADCSVATGGQHDGSLSLSTNDPDEALISLPVHLSCSSTSGNNAPVALDDGGYSVESGATLDVPASAGVLANDYDPDGDALSALLAAAPGQGALTLNADGSFTYVHDGASSGPHSFGYVASDGIDVSEQAEVTIAVEATGPPSIQSFSIRSADGPSQQSVIVDGGEPVSLAWTVRGSNLAIDLRVRQGASISSLNVTGKTQHHTTPSSSTGYTLVVSNEEGVVSSDEVAVRVRHGNDRGDYDLPDHTGFLTHYLGGDHGDSSVSNAYYLTIGAEGTLAEWIAARKDGNETEEVAAVYVNKADLGFGRDMHCWDYSYLSPRFTWVERYACYVGNYLGAGFGSDPADAFADMDSGGLDATVAMDYDESRPAGYEVQFYVYNAQGKLAGPLDLDSQVQPDHPNQFNPQNCLACHGGSYDGVRDMVKGANFLPFDALTFAYDDLYESRSLESQQESIRRLNEIAYKATYTYSLGGEVTSDIRELIDLWYGGNVGMAGAVPDFGAVPAGWQSNHAGTGFETWLPETLYHGVYRPYCRMCHVTTVSRNIDHNVSCSSACHGARDFRTYVSFTRHPLQSTTNNHASKIRDAVCETTNRPEVTMPHAEVPFLDFWQHEGAHGRLQIWILTQAFEAAGVTEIEDGHPVPATDCEPYSP